MSPRRLGLASLAAGLLVVVLAQLATPLGGPPLYDGIVPIEPYRWLSPPPGHPGGAEGASATVALEAGKSPLIALATPELSPQAQVFAAPGSLRLSRGATSIAVSIQPIPLEAPPLDGYVDGNVYSIDLNDQSGTPATAPASAGVTVVMRSADPTLADATIERFDGSAWRSLETSPAGFGAFLAVVTDFGDFAVVATGRSPYPTLTPTGASAGSSPTSVPTETLSPSQASSTPTPAPTDAPSTGTDPVTLAIASALALLVVGIATALVLRARRVRTHGGGWQSRR